MIKENFISETMARDYYMFQSSNLNFEQNVHFVRYMLGKASDEKLSRIRIKPEERDTLLNKDVSVFKHDRSVKASGLFYPKLSKEEGLSVISYHPSLESRGLEHHSLDTAMHETLHASRFWSANKKVSPVIFSSATAALGFANLFMDTPPIVSVAIPVLSMVGFGVGIGYRGPYNEEVAAFKAGAHFNKACYQQSDYTLSLNYSAKSQAKDLLGLYPSNNRINKLYSKVAKECTQGKGFFSSADDLSQEKTNYKQALLQFSEQKYAAAKLEYSQELTL